MSLTALTGSAQLDIALTEIGDRYGVLRLISPMAENRMLRAVERYGQLSPVVVNQDPDGHYEMVDGFKRLRALNKLGQHSLRARLVTVGSQVGKAALLQLNWSGKTVTELEEALVVQALCREDGLPQKEIAVLLDRHKSWVSRRLALVERLSGEVQEGLRLGLVTASSGRELAKLPRGNQEAASAAIRRHHLTYRETASLVADLLASAHWNHAAILRCTAILEQRTAPRRTVPVPDRELTAMQKRLRTMATSCLAVVEGIGSEQIVRLEGGERQELTPMIDRAIKLANQAISNLKPLIPTTEDAF